MKIRQFLPLIILIVAFPALAQDTCNSIVSTGFSRAGSACTDIERNQVCYGYGTLRATFDDANEDDFFLSGERAGTGFLQQLELEPLDAYPVAMMQLQLSLIDSQPGRNVALLAYGDVTLTNQVPVRPTIQVESTGVLTIRALPDRESDILGQYPLRTTVTANGLYIEGGWLRVEVPDTSLIGWVSLEIITTLEDINTLNIVDVDTPFLRPFQYMGLVTGTDDAPCPDTAESGILLQSPNTVDPVEITINGLDIRLSGTVYIQASRGNAMILRQIEGQTLLRSANDTQWLVTGAEITIPMDDSLTITGDLPDTVPLDESMLIGLPLNNLNYRVRSPEIPTQEEITARIDELTAEPLMLEITSIMSAQRCIYTARGRVTLYAGPATFREVIRDVPAGTRLYPVLRLSDSEGITWWQLSNSHWMLASRANSEGDCPEIPVTQVVDPPRYNTLILETCDTTNGPIRAGQWLRIEFTAGSWRTLGEALEASRVARGRITVNQQYVYVYADYPREVAEERFYRTFSGNWYATSGTFRITGNRLSYSVICDITVPFG